MLAGLFGVSVALHALGFWAVSGWVMFETPSSRAPVFTAGFEQSAQFARIETETEIRMLLPTRTAPDAPSDQEGPPLPEAPMMESAAGEGVDRFWEDLLASPDRPFRFFGISPQGTRVVFLIDVSGSMLQHAGTRTRLREAFDEVARGMAGMRAPQQFNIVLFGTEVKSFRPAAVPATLENKTAARRWLLSEPDCGGTTNLSGGMTTAIGMKPDVVLLLSDGEANQEERAILAEFRHLRRLHNPDIIIHTVGYYLREDGQAERMLRALSGECGGTYARWMSQQ